MIAALLGTEAPLAPHPLLQLNRSLLRHEGGLPSLPIRVEDAPTCCPPCEHISPTLAATVATTVAALALGRLRIGKILAVEGQGIGRVGRGRGGVACGTRQHDSPAKRIQQLRIRSEP